MRVGKRYGLSALVFVFLHDVRCIDENFVAGKPRRTAADFGNLPRYAFFFLSADVSRCFKVFNAVRVFLFNDVVELLRKYTRRVPCGIARRKIAPFGTGKFETIAVSSVIAAIGQVVDWGTLDVGALETTKKGTAVADSLTYQTAQPDIFVGGDCYTGPKFAIDAIAAGKEAAISLHRYVHPGQTLTMGRDRRVYKALDKEHALLDISHFDHGKRQMPGYNEAKSKTFADARVTFTEEQVRKETARCLGCGATKVDEYLCIGCGLCTTKCKFDAIHLKKVRDWHAGTFETMPIKVAEGLVKRAGGLVKNAVKK